MLACHLGVWLVQHGLSYRLLDKVQSCTARPRVCSRSFHPSSYTLREVQRACGQQPDHVRTCQAKEMTFLLPLCSFELQFSILPVNVCCHALERLKGQFTQKGQFCHHLLTPFQTCMTYFLWNTKEAILKFWIPIDFHCRTFYIVIYLISKHILISVI